MNWRSLLYVPANVARFLDKAQSRGADALILDLEDSVPEDRKAEARALLCTKWAGLCDGPSDLIVRINADMRNAVHDLEAVVQPGLSAIYLPKVSGPESINYVSQALSQLEEEQKIEVGTVKIIAMIETPSALEAAFSIATAHPRVTGLTLGSEDLATVCRMLPTPENLFGARQRIVFAARAACITPFGLLDSVANLSQDGLSDLVHRSRDFGFSGATAVHPDAVSILNEAFEQSDANRAWAVAVIAALDDAEKNGIGAARYQGRMIDRPMLLRAKKIMESRWCCHKI